MTQQNQGNAGPFRAAAAGLAMGLALLGSVAIGDPRVHAAQGAPAAAGLETIQIRPNVYVIFGAGSNITVHLGEDGVILVDAGTAAHAPQVVAAVKALTPQPIRLIINTSADPDHVTANEVVSA